MLKIYNTLTHKKEPFVPIIKGQVSMYACGITPYKESHLGHAMQGLYFDLFRRYFVFKGYKVKYVRNYTDVDDKIIKISKELGIDPLKHAQNIIEKSDKAFKKLRILRADFEPKVSEHISEIIDFIKLLIVKNVAYSTSQGNVYYSVSKFKSYGKLSGQRIKELLIGTRKDIEADKINPLDFALWKHEKSNKYWDSPWGNGRPGWHIECSAMSLKYLGNYFDIHGGGKDLIFPHHENEIAQSEIVYGQFTKTWMHNGLLMVGKEKMSKSLKNSVNLSAWLKHYHSEVIRYLIISNHYRSSIRFNEKRYKEVTHKVYEIYVLLSKVDEYLEKHNSDKLDNIISKKIMREFEKHMDNDFNTPNVIAMLNISIKEIKLDLENNNPIGLKTKMKAIRKIGRIIGLFDLKPEKVIDEMKRLAMSNLDITEYEINQLIIKRNKYRENKQFDKADRIRKKLEYKGVIISDSKNNTEWNIKF